MNAVAAMPVPHLAPCDGRVRVMVVDDHTLFRRGLVALLQADGRFAVVAEAGDAQQAQQVLMRCAATPDAPEVLLLDNHLPGVAGVDALPALLAAAPSLRVLMLTMSEDESDLGAALRAGACGYLLKSAESDELGNAIVRALRGQSTISEPMMGKLTAAFQQSTPADPARVAPPTASPREPYDTLSPRERETLRLIARGHSNKHIARELGIAEATVKIHVQGVLRKLGLASRVQAAAWFAARAGAS
jgi:two-component system nitrate/nitrite response regulator NarL